MKKIKKLNPSDIKIGNEYILASCSRYKGLYKVKVLDIGAYSIFARQTHTPYRSFRAMFSEYSIFDSYMENLIADLYATHECIIDPSFSGSVRFELDIIRMYYGEIASL